MKKKIRICFEYPGFHRWPDAPERRKYLRDLHRHLFKIEVEMEVRDNDREIEFHDLLDMCKAITGYGEQFNMECNQDASCELHAEVLLSNLTSQYCKKINRYISVTVSEDGECGATVINEN